MNRNRTTNRKPIKSLDFLLYIPIIIGLLIFVGAGKLALNSYNFKKSSIKTQGIVVNNLLIGSRTLYTAIIEFKTDTGETIKFRDTSSSNPPIYGIGEKVEVLYLQKGEKKAVVNKWQSLWTNPLTILFWGLIVFFMGIVAVRVFKEPLTNKLKHKKEEIQLQIIIPLLLGIVLLTIAFFTYRSVKKGLKNAIYTNGVVIDYAFSQSIQYKDALGIKYIIKSSMMGRPPIYKKGEIIGVYYDEKYPEKARINDFWNLWLLTTFFEGMGGVWFLVGVFYWKQRRDRKKRKKNLKLDEL